MAKEKFPKKVKVGHTIVKIYRNKNGDYQDYVVVHYLGNKRVKKKFSDLGLAKTYAQVTATKLSEGELKVLELTNEDRFAYARATQTLAPIGVALDVAAMRFVEALQILGGKNRLVEACRFYIQHHPDNMVRKKVPEVVKDMLATKEQDGASGPYLKDMKSRLEKFAEAFKARDINLLTAVEIDTFLRRLTKVDAKGNERPLSGRSRNNYRRLIGTLIHFAESRRYLPKGVVDLDFVPVAKQASGEITTFTTAELERILFVADRKYPELIPFLTIGAFAGVRHAELARLTWSDITADTIVLEARVAKTGSRRSITILPVLAAWFKEYRKETGPVVPYASMSKQIAWLAEDVDKEWQAETPPGRFKWKINAMRHSFISYHIARTGNIKETSWNAGNSPGVIKTNYLAIKGKKEAAEWFSLTPERVRSAGQKRLAAQKTPDNVVPFNPSTDTSAVASPDVSSSLAMQ